MPYSEYADWSVFDEEGQRKYLTDAERERFLQYADKQLLQKRALFYYLAFTGVRISEALALRPFHIDTERNVVVVKTLKRRRRHFRCVPIPDKVTRMLLELAPGDDAPIWAIHRVTAWRWIKQAMQEIQTKGPCATCHGLRHSYGVWAAMNALPQPILMRWMGHSAQRSSAAYQQLLGQQEIALAEAMFATHSERLAA